MGKIAHLSDSPILSPMVFEEEEDSHQLFCYLDQSTIFGDLLKTIDSNSNWTEDWLFEAGQTSCHLDRQNQTNTFGIKLEL